MDPAVDAASFGKLFALLPAVEKKKTLYGLLKFLAETCLDPTGSSDRAAIPAVAGLVESVVGGERDLLEHLVSWLTTAGGIASSQESGIRRAVMAVVSRSRDRLFGVLDKSVEQFGDPLYIKHAPMLQQEGE